MSESANPQPPAPVPAPAPDWRAALPQELASDPSLQDFKGVDALAKSYVEQKRMLGKPRLDIPDHQNWGDKEWQDFYSKVGRPETPDKYGFKQPELPPGLQYDAELDKSYAQWAHEAGLTPRQAEKLREKFVQTQVGQLTGSMQSMQAARAQAEESLRKEWGENMTANLGVAAKAVEAIGGKGLQDELERTGMGNNPALIKAFHLLGSRMQEDMLRGVPNRESFSTTQGAALQQITNLRMDADFQKKLLDSSSVGHAEAKEQWSMLFESAYPTNQKKS